MYISGGEIGCWLSAKPDLSVVPLWVFRLDTKYGLLGYTVLNWRKKRLHKIMESRKTSKAVDSSFAQGRHNLWNSLILNRVWNIQQVLVSPEYSQLFIKILSYICSFINPLSIWLRIFRLSIYKIWKWYPYLHLLQSSALTLAN